MKLSQITIIEAAEIDYTGIDSDIVDKLSPFPSHLQQWAIKEINKGEHASSVIKGRWPEAEGIIMKNPRIRKELL